MKQNKATKCKQADTQKAKEFLNNQDLPDMDLLALSRVGRRNMHFEYYVGGKILPSTRFCVPCKVLPPSVMSNFHFTKRSILCIPFSNF